MFDLMVDVESMGKESNAALLSIGARFFSLRDETLGPSFQQTIHLATAVRDGGVIEAPTVLWWLGQSQQARDGVRFGGQDIANVLRDFGDWIGETCRQEDVRMWGNNDTFDVLKIETACRRSGVRVPWHWVNCRDFRTVRAMYPQIKYDPTEKGDGAHNALADADFQVNHLFRIKRERVMR